MYAVGGSKWGDSPHHMQDCSDVHRMDASTGAWEVVAPMSHPRRCMVVCGRSDGDFYALGGIVTRELPPGSDPDWDEDWGPPRRTEELCILERYRVRDNRWVTLAPMKTGAKLMGASVANGSLWAVSLGEDAVFLDRYDAFTNKWSGSCVPLSAETESWGASFTTTTVTGLG